MTNERAIEIIEEEMPKEGGFEMFYEPKRGKELREACIRAINALRRESSDDALVIGIVVNQAEMRLKEFCEKWHLPYYEDNGEGSMGYEAYHLFDDLNRRE